MELERLQKMQAIATIASAVAVPVVVALLGWWVQQSVSAEGIKKDYVQMALTILREPDRKPDDELRLWALKVIDQSSPVPFNAELKEKLASGETRVVYVPTRTSFPMPPDRFMKLPPPWQEVPGKGQITVRQLLENHEANRQRYLDVAVDFALLQLLIRQFQAVSLDVPEPQRVAMHEAGLLEIERAYGVELERGKDKAPQAAAK